MIIMMMMTTTMTLMKILIKYREDHRLVNIRIIEVNRMAVLIIVMSNHTRIATKYAHSSVADYHNMTKRLLASFLCGT